MRTALCYSINMEIMKLSKDACSKKLFSIIQDVLHLQSSWIMPTKLINACANCQATGTWLFISCQICMYVRGIKIKMALNNKW